MCIYIDLEKMKIHKSRFLSKRRCIPVCSNEILLVSLLVLYSVSMLSLLHQPAVPISVLTADPHKQRYIGIARAGERVK